MPRSFSLSDFDFALPPELVAQHPLPERSASRLLDATTEPPVDRVFRDLPARLSPGDLLVFNDTRVIKARLLGHKDSGGAVEALVERVLTGHEVMAHLRASKSPRPGSRVHFAQQSGDAGFNAEVLGRRGADGSLFHLRFPADPFELLARHGHVPLPPYITHVDSEDDERRYQTVFAARPGAVAAPTAALHFDAALLQALSERGVDTAQVTLHVGAGTFQPVRTEQIEGAPHAQRVVRGGRRHRGRHRPHSRARRPHRGGGHHHLARTGVRGARRARCAPAAATTDIFITPGFGFRVVDVLVTNFHLPRSTLMMLVSAFAGYEHIRALYAHAIAQRYRFFSYGDAMLLARDTTERAARLALKESTRCFNSNCFVPKAWPDAAGSRSTTASSRRRCSCRWAPTAPSRA